ncbi:MAG: D-alanyl-D-alanine carboxypeptidase/D-alanyl-D-alanine-endopeptidase [Proteobacteria bacterium]|nr:D-alanyl-D-alanine carboxypeptidase/D-alanyl-D-alanine-endopeptidase [Pseudomonadota bacterium]
MLGATAGSGSALPADAEAAAGGAAGGTAQLAALLADRRLGGAKVGLLAVDLASGRVLAEHEADGPLLVASTVKLITAAAALDVLGPHYRFRTEVFSLPVAIRGGVLTGDLYLKGFGDPSLDAPDLWRLARRLRALGLRRVRGALVLDESYFDASPLPPLYETRDTDAAYRAATGALSLHENAVTIGVRPSAVGQPVEVTLIPASAYLQLENGALTVGPPRRSALIISARSAPDGTVVSVQGALRAGARPVWTRRRVEDPGLFVGITFRELLEREGIRFGRSALRRGALPPRARRLLVHQSVPLSDVIRRMNKRSSNLIAEQLVRVLGAEASAVPGTWAAGLAVIERHLAAGGLRRGSYQLKNGSGLYESAVFSPRQIVSVLAEAWRSFRWGPEFVASLAIAGADGTLAHRFVGSDAAHWVRGKTGTLADVVALSGYGGEASGQSPIAFSIVFNGLASDRVRVARRVADALVQALLAEQRRGPAPAQRGPQGR